MSNYGFTINVSGNTVQELKRIENELQKVGIQANAVTKNMGDQFSHFEDQLSGVKKTIIELFAIREIYNFGREIMNVTAEFEGFDNRIKFASLNSYDASRNINFLANEIDRLHTPMQKANEGFSEMEAGLVGTGIQGDRLRDLFDGISTAAATLHLPEYQLQRTLYDLKEIGEIGINQRIARSLSTALPGIGGIVKKTFGKSMHELQKEGISGTEFLTKLGPALSKNFESGLANYGASLQGQMADTTNTYTKFMLKLGHQLEPVFKSILSSIRETFNSAPVQFFIEHVVEIISLVGKLITMWISYNTVMLIYNSTVQKTGLIFKALEGIMATLRFGITGLYVTLGGFSTIMMNVGLGIFAAGLGLIIARLIQMSSELTDNADKLTNLKKVSDEYAGLSKNYNDISLAFKGRGRMGEDEKNELYADLQSQVASITSNLNKVALPSLDAAKANLANMKNGGEPVKGYGESDIAYSGRLDEFWRLENEVADNIAKLNTTVQSELAKSTDLQGKAQTLLKEGLKPHKETYKNDTDNTFGAGGLHGSHLSGAEGGLNQARIVNLKIDTVMKVTVADGKDLHKHAEIAADYIIRAANNLSESQSGQM